MDLVALDVMPYLDSKWNGLIAEISTTPNSVTRLKW